LVIENRAGAAGNVGMEAAARAPADGYTVFLGNIGTMAINPSVFVRSLKLDPARDFAPIGLVSITPDALVVPASLPVRTVREFVDYARAHPGQLNYGTPGAGSANRLEMELLREAAGGLDMVHVPYVSGAGQAVTALVAGDVQCMFVTLSSAIGQVQAGRLRALAVTTAQRVAALPEVPTMIETGPLREPVVGWHGIVAPVGTAPAILASLDAAVQAVLAHPEVNARLIALGVEPVSERPERLAALIRSDAERWRVVIRRARIAPV
jgi:tripartite-type tricarboxylate transporter receptor subunit TctC